MTPSTTIPRTSGPPPFLRRVRPVHLLAAGAVTLLLAVGSMLAPGTPVVDRLRLVNGSEYDVLVEARGPSGGWTTVGLADSDATTTVEQLGDHGDRWTFRFTAQGRPAGQVTVTRQQLEDGNWRFEIPPDVAARLRAERVPPTP